MRDRRPGPPRRAGAPPRRGNGAVLVTAGAGATAPCRASHMRHAARAVLVLAAPAGGTTSRRAPSARRSERGQASVELLGALPALILLGLVLFQLLAVGYSSVLAGTAAEAGALALAGGGDARAAARSAVPGWSRARMTVAEHDGAVTVSMRPPSPLAALSRRLEIRARAAVAR